MSDSFKKELLFDLGLLLLIVNALTEAIAKRKKEKAEEEIA